MSKDWTYTRSHTYQRVNVKELLNPKLDDYYRTKPIPKTLGEVQRLRQELLDALLFHCDRNLRAWDDWLKVYPGNIMNLEWFRVWARRVDLVKGEYARRHRPLPPLYLAPFP